MLYISSRVMKPSLSTSYNLNAPVDEKRRFFFIQIKFQEKSLWNRETETMIVYAMLLHIWIWKFYTHIERVDRKKSENIEHKKGLKI